MKFTTTIVASKFRIKMINHVVVQLTFYFEISTICTDIAFVTFQTTMNGLMPD